MEDGGVSGNRTRDTGFADPCLTTWLSRPFCFTLLAPIILSDYKWLGELRLDLMLPRELKIVQLKRLIKI